MNDYQKIHIDWNEYYIIDSIQNFRAEDSFIHIKNKLSEYNWHGESKKHIGTYNWDIWESRSDFFNYSNWWLEHYDKEYFNTNNKKKKTFKSAKENGALISHPGLYLIKGRWLTPNHVQEFVQISLFLQGHVWSKP